MSLVFGVRGLGFVIARSVRWPYVQRDEAIPQFIGDCFVVPPRNDDDTATQ